MSGTAIEYTWLLGGSRNVRLSGQRTATGDRISVTVPWPNGKTWTPVLLRSTGFDRLALKVGPGAKAGAPPKLAKS